MATKALLSVSVAAGASASFFTALALYDSFIHVEPMVSVKPSGKLIDVHLLGVAAPVKTTDIKHEGVDCLKMYKFNILSKADYRMLPTSTQKIDPAFTFVLDPSDYSDVGYMKFVEACLNCRVATQIKYKDFFGFEKEKRLPWF